MVDNPFPNAPLPPDARPDLRQPLILQWEATRCQMESTMEWSEKIARNEHGRRKCGLCVMLGGDYVMFD